MSDRLRMMVDGALAAIVASLAVNAVVLALRAHPEPVHAADVECAAMGRQWVCRAVTP